MEFNGHEYHAVKKKFIYSLNSIRPSEYIRNDLDIVYNINDRTIDIGEQRPVWQGEAGEKTSCHQQESSASALWTDGKFIGCKKI